MKIRWQFGIIAGIFLAVFATYPQFKLWYLQGDKWQGHYAYNDIDEVAYASYLKALIDGRPRKNDPYTGRDDSVENRQPESLFSIQFIAPYTIAIPARIFGIPATWAMTLAGAFAGFLTAFACFWLIGMLTKNSLFAMMGSLVVLCGEAGCGRRSNRRNSRNRIFVSLFPIFAAIYSGDGFSGIPWVDNNCPAFRKK